MLKHAADLSDSHEYFIVWAGDTNARPWGTKADAYSLFPEFELAADGVTLTGLVIPDNGSRSTAVSESLSVDSPTLTVNEWANCRLRIGTKTAPLLGYGTIESNTTSAITVNWTILPTNNATVGAYIVRENRKWGSYPQVRILTPYQPVVDDATDTDVGYPTPTSTVTTRSLTLPAPYNGTTGATLHEDIGALLPFSFHEGIDGYGISEVANSSGTSYSVSCTSASPMVVTLSSHGLETGDAISFSDGTPPGGFTLDTTYYVIKVNTTTFKLASTHALAVAGTALNSSSTGTSPKISHRHPIYKIEAGGTVLSFSTAIPAANLLNGGYVIVDWLDDVTTGVMRRSWAPVVLQDTTTRFYVGAWLGDAVGAEGSPGSGLLAGADGSAGDLARGLRIKRYTAWIPHYNDSPYAYLPGEGFSYPGNDMMPCSASAIGAMVHNKPRQITGNAYGDKFGELLVAASRLSSAIGKRVNVVNLGVSESSLAPTNERNAAGFPGKLGWWDFENHKTWAPVVQTSIYQRLDKLLRTVLPNALKAESSTKTLRCLGIVFAQGETDALSVSARQHYSNSVKGFVTALRNLINTLGFNPYANGAEIPFVHPRIAYLPYSVDGTYVDPLGAVKVYTSDTEGLVNSAIEENAGADGFAASVKVDDLPRVAGAHGYYNGVGEAELGSRISDKLAVLIDYGLAHGSTALANAQTKLVEICNLALSEIGDSGQLTSLEDGSEQATLCKRFLPEARDGLLQLRQWGFALRRRQLVRIQKPEATLYQHFSNCYVMPEEALNAFTVLPPVTSPSEFDHTLVAGASYSTTFAANDGSGTDTNVDPVTTTRVVISAHGPGGGSGVVVEPESLLPIQSHVELDPEPYTVEQSPFGHRYIFTNQDYATLQYIARVVDADQYSPQFVTALSCYLGSMLAGVIIKGEQGEAVSGRLLQKTAGFIRSASSNDAKQQRPTDSHRPFGFIPDHLANR